MRQSCRLESISLREVGVFDDVRIDFKPIGSEIQDATKAEIHLFTGANGCGKSTVLYALAQIFMPLYMEGLVMRRFRHTGAEVDFQFAGQAGRYAVKPGHGENAYGKYQTWHGDLPNGHFFGYTSDYPNRLLDYKNYSFQYNPQKIHTPLRFEFAAFTYSGQRTLQQVPLTAIQQINNSPFEDALSFDQSVRPQVLLQWIANNRAQSALAKADGDGQAAEIYDYALERITGFIQEVCGLHIEFRLERSPLAVSLRVNGDGIQFDGLPDGLKSIISWVADLSLRLEAIPWQNESDDVFAQPIVLFLDEIDIHLHPKWQRRILPAVQKLLPNAQIFASTHSPFVVGSVEDAWVYRLPEPQQGHTSGLIEGIPSAAGKSYRLILEEVFGIDDEFDIETEKLFDTFYHERDIVLKTRTGINKLLDAARPLAARGEEASVIIDRELRQVSRLIGQEVRLA